MRAAISRAELFAFVRSLGADPMQVQKVELDGKAVTVTSYRLDERGYRFTEDGETAAIDTTAIEVMGDTGRDTVAMRHPNLPGRVIEVPAGAAGQHAMAGWEVASDEPAPVAPAEPKSDKQPEAPAPGKETPRGRRKSKESD